MREVLTQLRAAIGGEAPSRAPKHAPRVPFAILVTALIVGGMGLLLLLNTASAANEVSRHDLAARDASIAAQVEDRQNEVAASAAPGNLAQAAAALGMVPAADPAFLVVGMDGVVKVLGSAAPASGIVVAPPPATKARKSPTKAANSSKSSTSSSSTTKGATRPAGHSKTSTGSTKSSSSSTPTPTPTPTPTLSLPGGNR
jgi:hypothetical protein